MYAEGLQAFHVTVRFYVGCKMSLAESVKYVAAYNEHSQSPLLVVRA